MSAPSKSEQTAQATCPMNLEEVDLFAPGSQEYWFDSYRILHEEAPVLRIPGGGDTPDMDAFIVSKYEDVARIVRDFENFPLRYSEQSVGQEVEREIIREEGFGDTLDAGITLRPTMKEHRWHREQLTNPWVGAVGAERNREMITGYVNELVDRWIDKGEVELATEFAAPLPQMVITTILGFPLEDMPMLRKWEEAQVRRFVYGSTHRNLLPPEDEAENARTLVAFHEYIGKQVEEKRRNPKDDMISYLTQVEYGDDRRPLTDGEVVSVAYGMHIGGNETTQYALTAEAMLLAQNPDLQNTLRDDRSKVRFFVEEALRLYAPTQGLSRRRPIRDIEVQGVTIPKGSVIHLRYGAGNRDEEEYPNADQVDLDRPSPGRHVTFGQGQRSCPGAGLSRLEQNIATNVLLDRLDGIKLAPGKNDLTHQPGVMLGLWELNLAFDKRN